MIVPGVNAKALSDFMGHYSIKVTFDLGGHLTPGAEAEAATLLDDFLEGRNEQEGECHQPAGDNGWAMNHPAPTAPDPKKGKPQAELERRTFPRDKT
jgi:hypothetical protein